MTLWLDAQLSPMVASFINDRLGVDCVAVRELGLRDASDREMFLAAKEADAIVVTKDSDFIDLLHRFGPPPRILWLTCGNTSNKALRSILAVHLLRSLEMLESGEALVEISD